MFALGRSLRRWTRRWFLPARWAGRGTLPLWTGVALRISNRRFQISEGGSSRVGLGKSPFLVRYTQICFYGYEGWEGFGRSLRRWARRWFLALRGTLPLGPGGALRISNRKFQRARVMTGRNQANAFGPWLSKSELPPSGDYHRIIVCVVEFIVDGFWKHPWAWPRRRNFNAKSGIAIRLARRLASAARSRLRFAAAGRMARSVSRLNSAAPYNTHA